MSSKLYTNAKVWQPDGIFEEAFGIKNDFINFTGSNKEAESLKCYYDEVIDLNQRLVMPGLTDGHLHLVRGSLMIQEFDASGINNINSLEREIKKYSQKNSSKSWIIGSNLDINQLLKNYDYSNNFADLIYNEKPLFINNYDYHSAICNTKAMAEAGLLDKLNEFSAEEAVRDKNGKPAGIVKEKAQRFISDNIPDISIEEKANAVSSFIKSLHSFGITSVSDITLIEDLEVYVKLYGQKRLKIRINSYIPFEEFPRLAEHEEYTGNIDTDFFSIKGFKAFWDGALGSETALFSKNYNGKNHNGYRTEIVQTGKIISLAKKINSAGKQMIIHAIGDKAITEVLDLYESLYRPHLNTRHRIEHAQHIRETDVHRFQKLNVIASVQPLHLKYDANTVKEKLPEELVNNTHNYKNLIEIGGVVNFGTDFPIAEVNPFENIRLAVTRKTKDGIFTPELRIPLHECIKCYTLNNSYSNFNELAAGSIQKGKAADFVIMHDNLFDMNPDDISSARVFKTFLNGAEVYSA